MQGCRSVELLGSRTIVLLHLVVITLIALALFETKASNPQQAISHSKLALASATHHIALFRVTPLFDSYRLQLLDDWRLDLLAWQTTDEAGFPSPLLERVPPLSTRSGEPGPSLAPPVYPEQPGIDSLVPYYSPPFAFSPASCIDLHTWTRRCPPTRSRRAFNPRYNGPSWTTRAAPNSPAFTATCSSAAFARTLSQPIDQQLVSRPSPAVACALGFRLLRL